MNTISEYTNREIFDLEIMKGTCINRNMFLLTGIFAENHALVSHVATFTIDDLNNRVFIPAYNSNLNSDSSYTVIRLLMLGAVIGLAIAMVLNKYDVLSVSFYGGSGYGTLGMDSQHSISSGSTHDVGIGLLERGHSSGKHLDNCGTINVLAHDILEPSPGSEVSFDLSAVNANSSDDMDDGL